MMELRDGCVLSLFVMVVTSAEGYDIAFCKVGNWPAGITPSEGMTVIFGGAGSERERFSIDEVSWDPDTGQWLIDLADATSELAGEVLRPRMETCGWSIW